MLVARGGPGDRERAAALAGQALATAREVGMKPLEAKVVELQAAAVFVLRAHRRSARRVHRPAALRNGRTAARTRQRASGAI
jgi:hypothetical protein